MKLFIIIGLLFFSCNLSKNEIINNKSQKRTSLMKESELKDKELRIGDLIFHTSRSNQSRAIQIATNSKYSHMGNLITVK